MRVLIFIFIYKEFFMKKIFGVNWVSRLVATVCAVLVLSAGVLTCDMGNDSASGVGSRGPGKVARPAANPPAGEVDEGTVVALASATAGAVIYFTADGGAPDKTNAAQQYTGPIPITGAATIRAVAVKDGQPDSNVLTAVYTVVEAGKTARPSVNPPAGTVASGTVVVLASTTAGAVIRYTTNGLTPTATSPVYEPGVTVIAVTAGMTVKAFAEASGKMKSDVTTAEYQVAGEGEGTWIEAEDITLSGDKLVGGVVKLGVDEMAQLTATLTPADASGGVIWQSEKPAVVSVDGTGLVRAHSQGKVIIKAVAAAGGEETLCTVQVAGTTPGLFEGDESEPKDLSSYADKDNLIAKSLAWIKDNTLEGVSYTIVLGEGFTVDKGWTIGSGAGASSDTGSDAKNKNLKITLQGLGEARTVKIAKSGGNPGALFTVYGSAAGGGDEPELILGENITLSGDSDNGNADDSKNNSALVVVGSSTGTNIGKLTMNAGSRITGNKNSANSALGGGVYVRNSGATFEMNGGTIDYNSIPGNGSTQGQGGGVAIGAGTFAMSGGSIENNSAGLATYSGYGGGVYLGQGTFTMIGGTIKNNECVALNQGVAAETYNNPYGGGIYAGGGTFTMSGDAEITGNKAELGGGVAVNGTFNMLGGRIAGNRASAHGAAVVVGEYATSFAKTGGTIYGVAVGTDSNKIMDGVEGSVHSVEIVSYDWEKLANVTTFYYDNTDTNVNLNSANTEMGWVAVE
jgi:hypothetical protein